jgi:hypothetical protein
VRPQRGERLPDDVEKHSHRMCPHASGEGREGPRATFRRGVSIPPNHLISNTQPGHAKFPAVVRWLDRMEVKKVSSGVENPPVVIPEDVTRLCFD